ncbi:hypothetical protein XA68_10032 [Ophiocordyceps unilateralis]|uniref:Uncharacterized protein n=1 Tax=Ophiocordyceps unilateralis TaxID=268505 RepID=A0A2A9PTL1_OPHUN|nr:hypothetical protein XA68_10032 [Ophiocordyceps unilateralis]
MARDLEAGTAPLKSPGSQSSTLAAFLEPDESPSRRVRGKQATAYVNKRKRAPGMDDQEPRPGLEASDGAVAPPTPCRPMKRARNDEAVSDEAAEDESVAKEACNVAAASKTVAKKVSNVAARKKSVAKKTSKVEVETKSVAKKVSNVKAGNKSVAKRASNVAAGRKPVATKVSKAKKASNVAAGRKAVTNVVPRRSSRRAASKSAAVA